MTPHMPPLLRTQSMIPSLPNGRLDLAPKYHQQSSSDPSSSSYFGERGNPII
jgi:hypothetical protein